MCIMKHLRDYWASPQDSAPPVAKQYFANQYPHVQVQKVINVSFCLRTES